jgi:hypothetical protein
MSCFSPTRGALSSSSSPCPFAFKVYALCRHSLPWPCDFIPSAPRLSECSKWYTACLDGMRRYLPGGLVLGSLLSATFPPKSLCSLFPNSQRVGPIGPIFLRAAVGGAWPPGSMIAPCVGLPHPWRPPRRWSHCSDAAQGGRTRRRTSWRWRPRSWMVLSSPS